MPRWNAVLLVGGVFGCAGVSSPTPAGAPPTPCPTATDLVMSEKVRPTDLYLSGVSRMLVEAQLTGTPPDSIPGPLSATTGPARDTLRSALLSLTLYPPLRSDALAGRAGRMFLSAGGKQIDLVWAAENAPTLWRTREILRLIPDGGVSDVSAFASLRCTANAFLRVFDSEGFGPGALESSLGDLAVTYQSILEETDRISGQGARH